MMTKRNDTQIRWCFWLSWLPDKVETWLEEQAAAGWHLVKADRWLNRFHFRRGEPRKVRYFVDFPARVDDEYKFIYNDAGWEHVAEAIGWHVWRAAYEGDQRPEAFNDPEPLIERNNRIALVLIPCIVALAAVMPTIYNTTFFRGTIIGKVLIGLFIVLLLFVVACLHMVHRQNQQLKARKP